MGNCDSKKKRYNTHYKQKIKFSIVRICYIVFESIQKYHHMNGKNPFFWKYPFDSSVQKYFYY